MRYTYNFFIGFFNIWKEHYIFLVIYFSYIHNVIPNAYGLNHFIRRAKVEKRRKINSLYIYTYMENY